MEKPDQYDAIDQLLDAGRLELGQEALAAVNADEGYDVLRVKLEVLKKSLQPLQAMQKLAQLMRRDPQWPGARELYQWASKLSYATRQSSMAHSHPPPPTKPKV